MDRFLIKPLYEEQMSLRHSFIFQTTGEVFIVANAPDWCLLIAGLLEDLPWKHTGFDDLQKNADPDPVSFKI